MVAVGRSKSNHRASVAVLVALVAVLVVPGAVAFAHETGSVHLLDAVYAIPVGFLLGLSALAFARGARGRIEWTVGRAGGARRIRVARVLGLLAVCLAITAAISVGVYEFLLRLEH
jgi:hypothetical protein